MPIKGKVPIVVGGDLIINICSPPPSATGPVGNGGDLIVSGQLVFRPENKETDAKAAESVAHDR